MFTENSTEYYSETENVFLKVKVFVPQSLNVKIIKVHIENPTEEEVRLKFESVIIMNRKEYGKTVSCTRDGNSLFYTNTFNSEFQTGTVFISGLGMKVEGTTLIGTADKESEHEKVIFMGYGRTFRSSKALCNLLTEERVKHEEFKLEKEPLSTIKINTPSRELNLLYNNFLVNQIIKCRLYAKTGFHQCSGAYGFRDQLQDTLCISVLDCKYLRQQILTCASHQFIEGDVMHWFHKEKRADKKITGVRTKSSDDLLWLPFAICEYIEKTDDIIFLKTVCNYISAEKLDESTDEKFVEAEISELKETVYEHGKKALIKAATKGEHGLVQFGSGDWNDGFNKLNGGETVWGTFFIITVLEKFANICDKTEDTEFLFFCKSKADSYRNSINSFAWSKDRYIRGFRPSGEILGDETCSECKIDLITQSFAAICGGFDSEKVITALDTAEKYLADKTKGIYRLFTPPFHEKLNSPGYITGYIPGVRENGGQYTHAAIWYALALLKTNQPQKAFEVLELINPIHHSKTLSDVMKYRNEPYVLSADIYTNPAHFGMGGWSWYTGSAGWFFKTVTEELLGIKQKGNCLFFEPKIPENWYSFSAEIKKNGSTVSLKVIRSADSSNIGKLIVNNKEMKMIPLDGETYNATLYI